MRKYRVAILGSGNIGTDLLIKVGRSELLECVAFVGRSQKSAGMIKARSLGVYCSDKSIGYIIENPEKIDLVFDATSAKAHSLHAPVLKNLGKKVIDLTPAKIGPMCVPVVNLNESLIADNVNMITCGGQTSIPVAYAIGQSQTNVDYIEVVSSIASRSAGPATRANLDEYIGTTEKGLNLFSGVKKVKAILNLNPAVPCIDMQTTIFAKVHNPDLEKLKKILFPIIDRIKRYVPGYTLLLGPIFENNRIVIMIKVKGLGDYLPEYAGNLDIINCAAITMAEEYAKAVKG